MHANTNCWQDCSHVMSYSLLTGMICSIFRFCMAHYTLKGQFTPKSKTHIFSLTFNAIYQSRLFWCEFPSFGWFYDIGCAFVFKHNGTKWCSTYGAHSLPKNTYETAHNKVCGNRVMISGKKHYRYVFKMYF